MSVDIMELVQGADFTLNLSGDPPLRVGTIPSDAATALRKEFPDSEAADPGAFARALLSCVAFHMAADGRRGRKLTDQEIAGLDQSALQHFARAFVEHDRGLFDDFSKDAKRIEGEPTADGKRPVRYVYDKVEIPRAPADDDLTYLRRVVGSYLHRERAAFKRLAQQMEELIRPTKNLRKLLEPDETASEKLRKLLRSNEQSLKLLDQLVPTATQLLGDNVKLSDRLGESLRSTTAMGMLDNMPTARARQIGIESPEIYIPPNPIHETNDHLKAVGERLDSLTPLMTNSAALIKNMNDLGIAMAESSTAHATRTAKQNRVMIIIALIALILTTVFSGVMLYRDILKDVTSDASTQRLIDELAASSKESAAFRDSIDNRLQELVARQSKIEEGNQQITAKKGLSSK